jgi:hypothetical protein
LLLASTVADAQFAQQAQWAGTSTGSANTQYINVANVSNLPDLLGVTLTFIPGYTNTSATTLGVNSLTPQPVKLPGQTGPIALAGGELLAGGNPRPVQVVWDGSEFLIVAGSPTPGSQLVHYGVDTSSTPGVVTVPSITPGVQSYATGALYRIAVAATNPVGAMANIGSLGARTIVLNSSGTALHGGEIQANGAVSDFTDDGTYLRLMNPVPGIILRTTSFTSSGTITPLASHLAIREWGGGAEGSPAAGGAGGSSGGYCEKILSVTPGVPITVNVGAGGLGATQPTASSVAGTVIAGGATNTVSGYVPGAVGTYSGCDFGVNGNTGGSGISIYPGAGAGAFFGSGYTLSSGPTLASFPGGGSQGGSGIAGANGFVIIQDEP